MLEWSPTTSSPPPAYNYGTLDTGQTASQAFTLTNNSNKKASGALTITLTLTAGAAAFTDLAPARIPIIMGKLDALR